MALTPIDDIDIVVFERDDPLLRLTITELQSNGSLLAYNFTTTIGLEFLVKNRASDAVAVAIAKYTLSTGTVIVAPATAGICTVQCLSTNATLTPGRRRYQLVGIRSGNLRQTLMNGNFIVKDV